MHPFKATFLGLASAATFSIAAQAEDKPNIILVMADDQGYGDMGYNGHPFVKTPEFDKMSKDSVVFNRFYSAAPVCSPTRASVMTGRTPIRTNIPNHGHYMRPHETTLPEALKQAGYVTGHFGKWHIGSVQPESPTSPGKVGFDEWLTNLNFFDQNPYFATNSGYVQVEGQGTVITMDATIDFLKKHKDGGKPMFAVTWFPSPHDPHAELPETYDVETLYKDMESKHGISEKHRGYFLEITLMDEQMGRLRKELREMGIADNTIVWYCSDNGGLVKESSGGRAKKGSIYEGGLRVPAMLEWPAKFKHSEVNVPAITSDIYPTLLDIAGVTVDHQPKLDGVDLLPIIEGSQDKRPAMGFWHHHLPGQATFGDRYIKQLKEAKEAGEETPLPNRLLKNVNEFPERDRSNFKGHAAWTQWPWKLHRIVKKGGKETIELYNLESDPMEENDLSKTNPEKADAMLKEIDAWQNLVFDSWEGKDYQSK